MESLVKLNIEDLLNCINGKDPLGEDLKVKIPPHNKVKDEFNKFINTEIAQRRKKSSITNMRKFHNFIKQTMLTNITKLLKSKEINLLDIAVGRGGDMFKWNNAGIKHVFGFDKSNESINSINPFDQGAKERYRLNKINTLIEYHVGDAMMPSADLVQNFIRFQSEHPISIISCQFAMHYFFKDLKFVENVFHVFSKYLPSGGYFFGTTTNASKIKTFLKEKESNELFDIKKTRKSNEYTFKINDTLDKGNYFNTIGESVEYFVNFNDLIEIAKKYNLEPVYIDVFEKIPGKPNEYPVNRNEKYEPQFVSFEQIYNLKNHGGWNGTLTPNETILNGMYTTFLFKKK